MLDFLKTFSNFIKTYSTPIKIGCIIAGGLACFSFGYDKAENKYLLQIESKDRAHAEAIAVAQNEVRVQYDNDIKKLSKALADADRLNDDRLRQLEKFNRSGRDLEACLSDRSSLARVAIGLEDVARRAITNLESVVK